MAAATEAAGNHVSYRALRVHRRKGRKGQPGSRRGEEEGWRRKGEKSGVDGTGGRRGASAMKLKGARGVKRLRELKGEGGRSRGDTKNFGEVRGRRDFGEAGGGVEARWQGGWR